MSDVITTPITQHKIPGGYWKLVAYVDSANGGVRFQIEHTRNKETSIPCSEAAAGVLLAMSGSTEERR